MVREAENKKQCEISTLANFTTSNVLLKHEMIGSLVTAECCWLGSTRMT